MNILKNWIPNQKFTFRVLRLILPIALGQMIVASVSYVDQFMVGNMTTIVNPLTTVLIVTEFYQIAMGFNLGISLIGDIFGAQFLGANMVKKFKAANKIKLVLNVGCALLLTLILNVCATQLLRIFISDQTTLRAASLYLRLLTIGHIMYSITLSFIGALNTIGKPRYQLYSSLLPLFLNALFDFIFIYLLHFNLEGAAYATIISRGLEMLLVFFFVYINRDSVWFGWNFFSFDIKVLISMLKRSLIVTSQVAFAIGLVAKTFVWTNNYDEISEAIGIGYAISGLLWASFPGFSSASKIIIGKNMAQNKFDLAYDEARKMLVIVIIIGISFGLITLPLAFFLPQIVGLASKDIDVAKTMIIAEATLIVFLIIAIYIFSLLETGGFSKASTFLNSYYILIIVFPFASLMAKLVGPPFDMLYWLTQSIHAFGVFAFSLPFFFRKKWLRNITISHR